MYTATKSVIVSGAWKFSVAHLEVPPPPPLFLIVVTALVLLIPSSVHAQDTGKILVSSAVILLGAAAVTAGGLWLASDNDCSSQDGHGICTEGYNMSSTDKALAIGSMVAGSAVIFSGIWVLFDSDICVACNKERAASSAHAPVTPSLAFSPTGAQLNLRVDM